MPFGTVTNGTAVCKPCDSMSLCLSQLLTELLAWPLHKRIAMATAFEDSWLDPAGPVGDRVGGQASQQHRVQRMDIPARPRRQQYPGCQETLTG